MQPDRLQAGHGGTAPAGAVCDDAVNATHGVKMDTGAVAVDNQRRQLVGTDRGIDDVRRSPENADALLKERCGRAVP